MNIQMYGSGDPLVLLHGWGFDSRIFSPLIPVLKDSYRLYCVDLPGFGHSQYMEWAVFQSELLQRLPDNFAVAGWSLGGLYATRLALENPQRISHLLNIASSPRFLEDKNWMGVKPAVLETFHNSLSRDPVLTLKNFIALQKYNALDIPVHLPSEKGLQTGLQVLHNWDLREALADFKKPACYMFGRLDAITPASTMQRMQILYPDFDYYLFKKSGHVPFLSESSIFVAKLKDFLS